ncbi:MAG TPA: hypothetical protein VNH11_09605 [Pirellulales bacterium]|nr:hypothetical protein [Pirellulales bacterium]
MKLPAYAGNLFDPDRFAYLEGRKAKTSWQSAPADPLPVNNRTVLHLLRSLQYLRIHGEAQRVSFRALGIEQIGHVYEGLLDHTAKRATEPVLGLSGGKGKEPEIVLSELEKRRGVESGERRVGSGVWGVECGEWRVEKARRKTKSHPLPTPRSAHPIHTPHPTLHTPLSSSFSKTKRAAPSAPSKTRSPPNSISTRPRNSGRRVATTPACLNEWFPSPA